MSNLALNSGPIKGSVCESFTSALLHQHCHTLVTKFGLMLQLLTANVWKIHPTGGRMWVPIDTAADKNYISTTTNK